MKYLIAGFGCIIGFIVSMLLLVLIIGPFMVRKMTLRQARLISVLGGIGVAILLIILL